jgi:hypothetical protein
MVIWTVADWRCIIHITWVGGNAMWLLFCLGAPKVLLFDIGSVSWKLNEWKADLWNLAKVPTPQSDIETNDAVLLGYTVAWFLEEVSVQLGNLQLWYQWLFASMPSVKLVMRSLRISTNGLEVLDWLFCANVILTLLPSSPPTQRYLGATCVQEVSTFTITCTCSTWMRRQEKEAFTIAIASNEQRPTAVTCLRLCLTLLLTSRSICWRESQVRTFCTKHKFVKTKQCHRWCLAQRSECQKV